MWKEKRDAAVRKQTPNVLATLDELFFQGYEQAIFDLVANEIGGDIAKNNYLAEIQKRLLIKIKQMRKERKD